MFDTSIVRPRAVAAPHRYRLLTASVILHSAVLIAAISASVVSTTFPTQAPDQLDMFRPVDIPAIPPPLGRLEAPRTEKPAAAALPEKRQLTAPQPATGPVAIPVETPAVEPPLSGASSSNATASGSGSGEVGYGDPNGVPGGVGEVPTQPEPEIAYRPGGEVRAAQVLRRVEPRYPTAMLSARLREVSVTVRGIVGKDGRIREAQVVRSSFTPFNESVLEALQQWTFAPGRRRGEAVDTHFELTVKFMVR